MRVLVEIYDVQNKKSKIISFGFSSFLELNEKIQKYAGKYVYDNPEFIAAVKHKYKLNVYNFTHKGIQLGLTINHK
jgi:hypothetical protein